MRRHTRKKLIPKRLSDSMKRLFLVIAVKKEKKHINWVLIPKGAFNKSKLKPNTSF